jgi:uncharacterized protein
MLKSPSMTLLRPSTKILLCICVTAASCFAQTTNPAKEAKVEELFKASKMDILLQKTLENSAAQLKSGVMQQMMGIKLNPDQQKLTDEYQDKVQKVLFTAFSWDNVKPIYLKLYEEKFTDSELDGIIAFYRSPAGQAFVDKAPKLMADASMALQQRLQSVQPQIRDLMNEFTEKAKATAPSGPKP